MAKKQWNARLTEETILAIKVAAAERHCSEGEVIEFWASGSSGVTGNTVACDAAVAGSSPALPTIQKDEKRAMFEALKAKLEGKPSMEGLQPIRLAARPDEKKPAGPPPSFDVSINGEPHLVISERLGWARYYKGEDGPCNRRGISEAEAIKLWESTP